jgi:branched-chain amino acid transport system substrate-binding protein
MKDAGTDALFTAHNAAVLPRVTSSCLKSGYEPTTVGSISSLAPDLVKSPDFEGSLWSAPNANYQDTSIPGVAEMTAALEKFSPETLRSNQYTQLASYAWIGGKLFEAASEAAGGFTPTSTPADVIAGLYKLKDETLGGMAPPLTFHEGQPSFSPCYFTAEIHNQKLESTEGGKPTCLPEEQLDALLSALQS